MFCMIRAQLLIIETTIKTWDLLHHNIFVMVVSVGLYCPTTITIAQPYLTCLLWWWCWMTMKKTLVLSLVPSTLSHHHYWAMTWAYTNVHPSHRSATKCDEGCSTYTWTWLSTICSVTLSIYTGICHDYCTYACTCSKAENSTKFSHWPGIFDICHVCVVVCCVVRGIVM